jgi:hypothetical protein
MNCDTATELLERLAADEIERSEELAAHLDACPRCAADLAAARLINQWLVSGGMQAPRHFTATVLQQLPSRTSDVKDVLEGWFDSMAALSLLPVIVGIWFLADPSLLRQIIDTITPAVSEISDLLLKPGAVLPIYVAIAVAGVIAVISLGFEEA